MCLWNPLPEHIGTPGAALGEWGLGIVWDLVSTPATLGFRQGGQLRAQLWEVVVQGVRGALGTTLQPPAPNVTLHSHGSGSCLPFPGGPPAPLLNSRDPKAFPLSISNPERGPLVETGMFCFHLEMQLHSYCRGDRTAVVCPNKCAQEGKRSSSCPEGVCPPTGPEQRPCRNTAHCDSAPPSAPASTF